jgi:hypothetical protein
MSVGELGEIFESVGLGAGESSVMIVGSQWGMF